MTSTKHSQKVLEELRFMQKNQRFFEPHLGTEAGKLKAEGIPYFNLPAGLSCPGAGRCKNETICYAMLGNTIRFPSVIKNQVRNYLASLKPYFVDIMIDKMNNLRTKSPIFRIHESGDFYSQDYIAKWVEIIRNVHRFKFYAYTKSFTTLDLSALWSLENMQLIQSTGSKNDSKIDYSKPHAVVFKSSEELKKASFIDASKKDSLAANGNTKIGLIVHGANAARY